MVPSLAAAVFAVGVGLQHGLLDTAHFANFPAQLAIFNRKAGDELDTGFDELASGLEFLVEIIHAQLCLPLALRSLAQNRLDAPEALYQPQPTGGVIVDLKILPLDFVPC